MKGTKNMAAIVLKLKISCETIIMGKKKSAF